MTFAYHKGGHSCWFCKSKRAHARDYNGVASLCCSCEGIDNLGWPYIYMMPTLQSTILGHMIHGLSLPYRYRSMWTAILVSTPTAPKYVNQLCAMTALHGAGHHYIWCKGQCKCQKASWLLLCIAYTGSHTVLLLGDNYMSKHSLHTLVSVLVNFWRLSM